MKKLLILSILSISLSAEASVTPAQVKTLTQRVKDLRAKAKKRLKASHTLIEFHMTPNHPVQNESPMIFAEVNTGFTDRETYVMGHLDGAAVTMDNPSGNLWVYNSPALTEIREHQFTGQVMVRSVNDANQLRESIAQLATEIDDLNHQIDNTTDPAQKAALIAQRDQKVTLKAQLTQSLADLLQPIGEEQFKFQVAANTNDPSLPRITGVSPNIAPLTGGAVLRISGANFAASSAVKIGGIPATVNNVTSSQIFATMPTFSAAGPKDVEVTFTDSGQTKNFILKNGVFATADLASPINQPPVFDAPFYYLLRPHSGEGAIGTSGLPIRAQMGVDGNGVYDPDGQIVKVVWNFGDGTSGATVSPWGDAFLEHDYMQAGDYTVTATAYDNQGGSSQHTQVIHISNTDYPEISFQLNTNYGGNALAMQVVGTASDSDGIGSVSWRWGDGTRTDGGTEILTATHIYSQPGVYVGRLVVIDPLMARTDKYFTAYVGTPIPSQGIRPEIEAKIPTREVLVGQPITYDLTESFDLTPGAGPLSYSLNMGDWGTCPDGCTLTSATGSHTYPANPGNYTVSGYVTGSGGAVSPTIYEPIYVVNTGHAPRALITPDLYPIMGVAPFTVTFDSSYSYDYDGTIVSRWWNLGDWNACPSDSCTATTPTATHTYAQPGSYWVNVTVTDNDGNNANTGIQVVVNSSYTDYLQRLLRSMTANPDPERAHRKAMLSQACAAKVARACFDLSQMYREDGDTTVADQTKARACTLGYTPACSVKN